MASILLVSQDAPIFTTHGFAQEHELSISAASHRLTRLRDQGLVESLTQGVWYQPKHKGLSRFSAVPLLLGKEQGYISFLTALNLHDVIEQIPSQITVATTGYPRKLNTPLGIYEFIKLSPTLMLSGYDWSESAQPYLLASPEKALLDTFYISTRKGRRFHSLPEIDWDRINKRKLRQLLNQQVKYQPIKSAILEKCEL